MRYFLILATLFVIQSSANAQSSNTDLNIFIGAPQGEFSDNLDRVAYGIDLGYAYQFDDNSPIFLGAEIGIMTYGIDRRRENFNPNIPEVRVNVETDYDILQGHAFIRFQAPQEGFKPYLDALVGFKYLFTETRIEDNGSYNTIASDTNFDDTALSYGLGAGFKLRLTESEGNTYFLNLKSRYLFGSEASYLQPGSITVNGGTLTFDESTSKTDLLTIHLGLGIEF